MHCHKNRDGEPFIQYSAVLEVQESIVCAGAHPEKSTRAHCQKNNEQQEDNFTTYETKIEIEIEI